MCGIFGIIPREDFRITQSFLRQTTDLLFKLSESRGKDASGMAVKSNQTIYVIKAPVSPSKLIRSTEYRKTFQDIFNNGSNNLALFGHSRLATDGVQTVNNNNQPIIKDGSVVAHNGIIVNHHNLWNRYNSLKRSYEIDTEIIPALIQKFYEEGNSLKKSIQMLFKEIYGSASIALFFKYSTNQLILGTNTGSLYICLSQNEDICIFASEIRTLKTLKKKRHLRSILGQCKIFQLKPEHGALIDISSLNIDIFGFNEKTWLNKNNDSKLHEAEKDFKGFEIMDFSHYEDTIKRSANELNINDYKEFEKSFQKLEERIRNLKRCTKCILPETMPFIEFDEKGVCNYCRNYRKINPKGRHVLEDYLNSFRNKYGELNCILTFSGGRDSSYALHYLKKVLNINPIAYTYDWGMITDLGRRNQSRMCGKLGVEHIIVSADIAKKRTNIRKNVLAWLKKPDLGTIPLFMAGDKQYFYHAIRLSKQMNAKLIMIGSCLLEKANFKTSFCNIKPVEHSFNLKRPYALSIFDQIKLIRYYGKQYLLNPAYLNYSIFDTMYAYFSYYMIPHDFLNLYFYIPWDEKVITKTLIEEYEWETAKDTKTTWRIGDGTAGIYNYIYYTVAGFSEIDTFRSNQIREEMISREIAMRLSQEENQPRFDSIKWYCDTIGIDFEDTLRRINSISKLYMED